MRLQKYLADCGVASRRASEQLIKDGAIKVNGEIVTEMGVLVSDRDVVEYKGKRVLAESDHVYFLLNKPRGYICACSDDRGRKTVIDLIETDRRIFPVGRLDYTSEGLLILTDDGEYANRIMHPSNNILKIYEVTINKPYTKIYAEQLRKGIDIGEKTLACAKRLSYKNRDDGKASLLIGIVEGRNREIRRMLEKQGFDVLRLKRICIGNLTIDGIKSGEYKKLSKQEAEDIL